MRPKFAPLVGSRRHPWLPREAIARLTGLPPIVPASPGWYAQMATVPLPPCDPGALERRLSDEAPASHREPQAASRDAVYGRDFRGRAERVGIDAIATPVRSPRANAVAERVIGTLRRECLDHLIVLNEQHLASVLAEFVGYYNQDRPHRTLGLQPPDLSLRPVTGPIRSRPVLNGLHHAYERAV